MLHGQGRRRKRVSVRDQLTGQTVRGGTIHTLPDGFQVEYKGLKGSTPSSTRTTGTYIFTGDISTPKLLVYVNDNDDCFVLEYKSKVAKRHSKLTKYDGRVPLPSVFHEVYIRLSHLHKSYFNS